MLQCEGVAGVLSLRGKLVTDEESANTGKEKSEGCLKVILLCAWIISGRPLDKTSGID